METSAPTTAAGQRQFPCSNCGANLVFEPGTTALKCPYCGTANQIAPPAPEEAVAELDYHAHLAQLAGGADTAEVLTVKCGTCGAETELEHTVAGRCAFCGAAIVAQAMSRRLIKPKSLLPFHITRDQAGGAFKQWVASRWFAPNDLVRTAQRSAIDGAYIPAWTYDADTHSSYTGQRGDDYWDTETYTAMENGRSVTRTRQVRKTRWRSVSGWVANTFDDVLVLASQSLPPKHAAALEPWDLKQLVPYRDEYLSGFVAESYQLDLPHGFEVAKTIMAPHIEMTIRHDIGGDHQRIHSADTRYDNVTFKHLLLPVWISAYRYAGKTFRFLVNARTGEVQGERPYSWIKITLAVLAALIVAVLVWAIAGGDVRI